MFYSFKKVNVMYMYFSPVYVCNDRFSFSVYLSQVIMKLRGAFVLLCFLLHYVQSRPVATSFPFFGQLARHADKRIENEVLVTDKTPQSLDSDVKKVRDADPARTDDEESGRSDSSEKVVDLSNDKIYSTPKNSPVEDPKVEYEFPVETHIGVADSYPVLQTLPHFGVPHHQNFHRRPDSYDDQGPVYADDWQPLQRNQFTSPFIQSMPIGGDYEVQSPAEYDDMLYQPPLGGAAEEGQQLLPASYFDDRISPEFLGNVGADYQDYSGAADNDDRFARPYFGTVDIRERFPFVTNRGNTFNPNWASADRPFYDFRPPFTPYARFDNVLEALPFNEDTVMTEPPSLFGRLKDYRDEPDLSRENVHRLFPFLSRRGNAYQQNWDLDIEPLRHYTREEYSKQEQNEQDLSLEQTMQGRANEKEVTKNEESTEKEEVNKDQQYQETMMQSQSMMLPSHAEIHRRFPFLSRRGNTYRRSWSPGRGVSHQQQSAKDFRPDTRGAVMSRVARFGFTFVPLPNSAIYDDIDVGPGVRILPVEGTDAETAASKAISMDDNRRDDVNAY